VGFLAPWFLAGVAVVGLPFWIHLLRQYRSTPHPFSSLMFFERRTQSSIKHRRLRYLLLLSLRVALLILMALAFANPFVTRTAASGGGVPLDPAVVRGVQRRLRQFGYYHGPADGVWGMRTEQAMERFQRSRGLEPTGDLNPVTASALGFDPNNLELSAVSRR